MFWMCVLPLSLLSFFDIPASQFRPQPFAGCVEAITWLGILPRHRSSRVEMDDGGASIVQEECDEVRQDPVRARFTVRKFCDSPIYFIYIPGQEVRSEIGSYQCYLVHLFIASIMINIC
jgi:hypothetical protein